MMWRHRFITDSWAWELPMGLVEENETPEEAAAREVPGGDWLAPWPHQAPDLRRAGQRHHRLAAPRLPRGRCYLRRTATEKNESDRIEWIPLSEVRA